MTHSLIIGLNFCAITLIVGAAWRLSEICCYMDNHMSERQFALVMGAGGFALVGLFLALLQ